MTMKGPKSKRSGFTLIEITVVVTILAMMASMLLPSFADTVNDAEVTAAKSMLARMRTGVDFYNMQHRNSFPGETPAGAWSAATFDNQLRLNSDIIGNTAALGAAGFPFGPYLTETLPTSPFNDLSTVLLIQPGDVFAGPNDTTGWVYWADTGIFKLNTTATAPDGTSLYSL